MSAFDPKGASEAFASPSLDQLTGLVMELAAQLHVERARRIALEAALEAASVLAPNTTERIAATDAVKAKMRSALNVAMDGLITVMTESPDVRAPLRPPGLSAKAAPAMEQ